MIEKQLLMAVMTDFLLWFNAKNRAESAIVAGVHQRFAAADLGAVDPAMVIAIVSAIITAIASLLGNPALASEVVTQINALIAQLNTFLPVPIPLLPVPPAK